MLSAAPAPAAAAAAAAAAAVCLHHTVAFVAVGCGSHGVTVAVLEGLRLVTATGGASACVFA